MIIVNQNKTEIINFDNITKLYVNTDEVDVEIDCVDVEGYHLSRLGEYKTEERAKEVLLELANRILLTQRFGAICIPERQDKMVMDMYNNQKPLFIYEMPEK